MREAACQVNEQTATYCYVEAAMSTHPSDLYLYQLPLGLRLPNTTVPSCTTCVQRLMGVYAARGISDTELKDTYSPAAAIVNNACGAQFVATVNAQADNSALSITAHGGLRWTVVLVASVALLGQGVLW